MAWQRSRLRRRTASGRSGCLWVAATGGSASRPGWGLGLLPFFFFQAEDGIRDKLVTGVQTCALPILPVFVHMGFDDNGISGREGSGTSGGLTFVRDLFAGKRNPAGKGNPRTYDGMPALF